ncbi:MAG: tetratricopeptide repeat protein, partial [Desulfobacteraceae bacterium]|nr:tetratricopeptide repeat protein [Desulfobacteraceae bacterium]
AIGIFDELLKEEPKAFKAHYLKGFSHLGKGEKEVAKASFSKALELNPKYIKARLLLGEIYLKEKNFDEAVQESNAVLNLLPENFRARAILGNALMATDKLSGAEKNFKLMVEQQPENPVGYYRLGILKRMSKNYDEALSYFEKALTINQKLMDVFTNMIIVHVAQEDFSTAIEKCDEQIIKVGDSTIHKAIIYNLKGGLYAAEKKMDAARETFQLAIETDPSYLKPYYALSKIYLSTGDSDKAIDQYKAILEKKPDQAGPHMLIGTLYDLQKKFDLSEDHYRAALKINPEFAPAANNLAYLLSSKDEKIDEALKLAQTAKGKLPDDPSVMDTLGWIYYKKGLYGNAIQEFSDSLEKIPGNAIVHYHLGAAYFKYDKKEKAKHELLKALEINENFEGAQDARKILAEL